MFPPPSAERHASGGSVLSNQPVVASSGLVDRDPDLYGRPEFGRLLGVLSFGTAAPAAPPVKWRLKLLIGIALAFLLVSVLGVVFRPPVVSQVTPCRSSRYRRGRVVKVGEDTARAAKVLRSSFSVDSPALDVQHIPTANDVPLTVTLTTEIGPHVFDRCPICLKPEPTEREHLPPESMGGQVQTRTCVPCNNRLGSLVEGDLASWYIGEVRQARISSPRMVLGYRC